MSAREDGRTGSDGMMRQGWSGNRSTDRDCIQLRYASGEVKLLRKMMCIKKVSIKAS